MRHEMRLQHDPFVKIAEQTKTIEMRLLDEKRSSVSAGDLILFTDISNNEKVECLVTNIYRYPSFEELYRHHSKNSIGYDEDEPADRTYRILQYSRLRRQSITKTHTTLLICSSTGNNTHNQ